MTDFAVKVVKIKEVVNHPNADRLSLATIDGWQCIIQRNAYQEGNLAVYIPIDSILTPDLEAKLFGPDAKIKLSKSRVRTIKIRGSISQGMLAPCDELGVPLKEGYDCTKDLKITKFEPPVNLSSSGGNPVSKKKKNPHFKEYGGLDNFKWYPDLFAEGTEEVVITEKIHGCLESNTLIDFVDGTTRTIKDVVDNKIKGEVWGIDDHGNMIPTKIINHFNNGKTKEWKYLKFTRNKVGKGSHFGKIICTPNHRFLNPSTNAYIRCDSLKVGDKLLVSRSDIEISYIQRSILVGKMLGDATYSSRAISFGHKKEHEQYLDETLKNIDILAGNKQKEQVSGFGTTMVRARTISTFAIENEFAAWFSSGTKEVPADIQLNPISLAYWYMDDGSLGHHEDQEDRAYFAVCGFSAESVTNLVDSLKNIGIAAISYVSDGYPRLRLNADEAEKLFVMISPYVVPCMRYKLPERYREAQYVPFLFIKNKYKNVLIEQEVLETSDIPLEKVPNQTRYDIETETHNFIANGVVVHNSNFRAGYVPTHVDTLWKRIKKFFNVLPEYEFVFGSNRVQLQDKKYKGYYDQKGAGNVYEEAVERYGLRENLDNGEVIYGEVYGSSVQKNYLYGCKEGERKLVVFDLMVNGEFVSSDVLEQWCKDRELDMVPVLYRGPFSQAKAKELTVGNSVLVPAQKVREGVVIKPAVETKCHMGRKVLKLISDAYLLDAENTDFH